VLVTSNRKWLRYGLPILAMASVAGVALLALRRPQVQVTLLGCGVFDVHGNCELPIHGRLNLLVQTDPWIPVTLLRGDQTICMQQSVTHRDGARLFSVVIPSGQGGFRLGVQYRYRTFFYDLPISNSKNPAWLQTGIRQWHHGQNVAAEKMLATELKGSQAVAARDRSIALFVLGNIARQQDRLEEAQEHFQTSIRLARDSGLLSIELDGVIALARLLRRRYDHVQAAEALWDRHMDSVAKMPEMQPWEKLHRSLAKQKAGSLRESLQYAEEGKGLAQRLGDSQILAELVVQRSLLLMQLGLVKESEQELRSLDGVELESCQRADLLAEHAWQLILRRQALRQSKSAAGFTKQARLLLETGLEIERTRCSQPQQEAKLLTNLAHVALLDGEVAAAAEHTKMARLTLQDRGTGQAPPSRELEVEWLDIEGKVALAQGDLPRALQCYETLAKLSQSADGYEATWRSLIGLAQASKDTPSAIEFFQQAESYLDGRSLVLPLGSGRGSFLGRFEWGTGLYISLLERSQRSADAMQVARHARARGLWALSLTERIQRLDAASRQRWRDALDNYARERSELDRRFVEEYGASRAGEQQAKQARLQQTKQLLDSLERALEILGQGKRLEPMEFPEPADAELVLTCHPAEEGWLCFAQTAAVMRSFRVQKLDLDADTGDLAASLLLPIADLLRPAKRLRILPYGELRQVDFHELRLDGVPLGEARDVFYGLDVFDGAAADVRTSPQPSPSPGPRQAVLLVDPDDTLRESRRAGTELVAQFENAGWQLRTQIGSQAQAQGTGAAAGESAAFSLTHRGTLLSELARSRLFHYMGHASLADSGMWGHTLQTSADGGVLAGDLLTLEHAPEAVLLFACNSGIAQEEVGGLEGLGLAQALVVRGSHWVLGTVRELDDKLAAAVATEFYRHSELAGGKLGPFAALREAVRRTRQRFQLVEPASLRKVQPSNDLGAFRILIR
jgi:tetratricopeptide (TPR) repeat protein